MRKKLIIDGNNLLHRAYWAYKKNEVEYKEGSQYSVYVFLNILKSYVRLFEPSEIIVCWDYREENESNERKGILEEYKGTRPDHGEVYVHMPSIRQILDSLGVKQMTPRNFEADDIMYWLCAKKYPNQCILITTDTDMYQLIVPELNKNVFYNPKRKMQINEVFLKQKFAVNDGYEFIVKKALRGDTADNISGVKGIRQARIENVIECLGRDFDIEALRKSEILKTDELELFERNIKLMKLDEIMNHPSEIEWYEENIIKEVKANKDDFKMLVKKLELWNIYRKANEWFSAFQKKSPNNLTSTYSNDYFNIFQFT
jgi:5'-3' exonuclease